MNKILLYCAMGVMLFLVVFSCITVHNRTSREDEITQGLEEALDGTIHAVLEEKNYSITDKNEFVADLIERLLLNVDSNGDITVNVLKADETKGVLYIEVVEKYKHVNGREGTVNCARAVIFDTKQTEEAQVCHIRLYLEKSDMQHEDGNYTHCYKNYSVLKGDALIPPGDPQMTGRHFNGWRDSSGHTVILQGTAGGDMTAYAFD